MALDQSADLLPLLRSKLDATTAEIAATQTELTRVREKLDGKLKHAPKKPTLSEEGLADRIEDLEFKRSTTSMSITDEKLLVREINDLKAQKSSLGGYSAFQAEVERLKASRTELSEKLRTAQATARELRDYVRKLEILERVRQANPGQPISTSDLRIAEIKVGAAHIPRLIGRKGATLREIEAAAGVTIDVDADENDKAKEAAASSAPAAKGGKGKGDKEAAPLTGEVSVKIMGLESGIMTAVGIIEAIAAQVENDIHVSSGLISYLISRSAAAIKALEAEFGVKLHAEKEGKTVSARGSPAAVESVRQRLQQLENGKAVVTIPGRALPSVLGKGGANFKKLREDGGAEIEIVRKELTPAQLAQLAVAAAATGKDAKQAEREKEREEPVELYVYGPQDAVATTLHELRSLIEEVREVEEAVDVPRDAIPWLVGSGGERIAAFQKDTGVYARAVKAEDVPALLSTSPSVADAVRRHGVIKPGQKQPSLPAHISLVTLRGTKDAMAKARPAFQGLMAEYARCNVILTVSLAQARAIVGPQGATIKQMRTDTGASIEVVEHGREEKRDQKDKESKEAAAGDAGKKGAAPAAAGAGAKKGDDKKAAPAAEEGPRRNRAEELNVPVGHAAVTIRGEAAKVAAAADAISAAIREYSENRVPVSSSVIGALVTNKGELISSLQKDTGAVVDIVRESAAAAAASAAAAGGKALTGSLTLQQLSQIPPGGGLIVISGTASAVSAAETRLREIIAAHQERIVALPDPGLVGEIVGKGGVNIKALQEELKVSLDVDKTSLSLRLTGAPDALDSATVSLQALFEKYAREHATIFVDRNLIPQVIGKGGATIKALQEETGAQIHTENNSGELRISGPEEAVAKAKAKLAEMLKLDQAADTISFDTAALSRLIGKGGANLRRLQEAHSVAIAVDPSSGVFTLRGDAEGIASAKLALKRQSREALRVEEDVVVPQDRIAAVIGAKGSKIRSIEADTGCSVDLPRSDRKDSKEASAAKSSIVVKLRGTPLAVSKAKTIVSAIASGKAVRALVRPGDFVAALREADATRALSSVQAETSTRVMLFDAEPPVDDEDETVSAADLPQGLIVVEASQWSVENPMMRRSGPSAASSAGGDEAGVARAVMAVDKLIGMRFGGGYAVIQLPQALVAALGSAAKASSASTEEAVEEGSEGKKAGKGKKGADVAEESSETLAAIVRSSGLTGASLDREGSYVSLWGSPAAVSAAKASINSLAESFAARHTEMTVDGWMAGLLIGKKGSGIASLESETGCKIKVEKDDDSNAAGGRGPQIDTSKGTVRIAAPSAEALAAAKEKLTTLLADLAKRRLVLVIPAAAFGTLIGKGGATIKGLQEATGANVDLDKDRDLVAIRGPSEDSVQHAKDEITALVEEVGYTVREATDADLAAPLPRVLSGYDRNTLVALVGKGGAGVKRLQEISGARISVDIEKGTVTVSGSSDRAIYDGVAEVEEAIETAQQKAAQVAQAAAQEKQAQASAAQAQAEASAAAAAAPVVMSGTRLPPGAAPLTAEERLALASKKGGRNARRREKKRLEKEGLLGPGAPEDSDEEEVQVVGRGAGAGAAVEHHHAAPAVAAAAPVVAARGAGAAAARPAAAAAAVTALPVKSVAAPVVPVSLPIAGAAAGGVKPVALPVSAASAGVGGGASANDILARLLPSGMNLTFQPMTLPTAGGAAKAAPAVAAAPAPVAVKAAPVAAAAPVAVSKPVFSVPVVAAAAPAPAPAPVMIGGVALQIPAVTSLNLSGAGGAGAAPSASASAALAAAGIGGLNLPSFNLQAFNPKATAAPVAAAPVVAVTQLPVGGAGAQAAAKRAPPGLASAPAPAPVAAAAKPVAAASAAGKVATQSAAFDLSSIGAALGLSGGLTSLPIGASAPAPVAAAAPAGRTITTLPLGGAGASGSASAAAALAGLTAPVGAAAVTSLAALLSSPNAKPAGSGARTGGAAAAAGGAHGGMWKGAGGVNVRL